MRFYDGVNFKKTKKICMKKVAGVQGLTLPHIFQRWDFRKKSNGLINLLLNARDIKLGHYGIFDMLFPFLAFFKL